MLRVPLHTQRQKLSTANFVAKLPRARLCDVNKSKKEGKDQESIQSTTTPAWPRILMGK